MGRPLAVDLVLATVLAGALVGCAPKGAVVTPSAEPTTALATPVAMPTAYASALQTPSPTVTPTPTATSQLWTPGPLATLSQPVPTPMEGEALDFYDYYSVSQGDQRGIVDKYGRIIIPARYSGVKVIDFDMGCDASTRKLPVRTLFLAVPVTMGDNKDMSRRQGWIVDTHNQRVTEQMFLDANAIGAHLLSVRIWDADRSRCGVMTDEGKLLLPCRYDYVAAVGSRLIAIDTTADTLELFTSEGKLLERQTSIPYESSFSVAGGRYWISQDQGKDVLLDDTLKRRFIGEIYSIRYASNDLFTVNRQGKGFAVNADGKVMLRADAEVTYETDWKTGKGYFLASGTQGAVYDEKLHRLLKVGACNWMQVSAGVLIVHGDKGSRALDLSDGHDLTGRGDIDFYQGSSGLFLFGEKDTSNWGVCRQGGEVLPLPACDDLMILSAKRFLLMFQDGSQGIYDEQGNWIIPPGLAVLSGSHLDTLLAAPAKDTSGLRYLIDLNGNRLWQEPASFGYFEGDDAFNVHVGTDYGIRDIYGRWLWKASDYQDLQD